MRFCFSFQHAMPSPEAYANASGCLRREFNFPSPPLDPVSHKRLRGARVSMMVPSIDTNTLGSRLLSQSSMLEEAQRDENAREELDSDSIELTWPLRRVRQR